LQRILDGLALTAGREEFVGADRLTWRQKLPVDRQQLGERCGVLNRDETDNRHHGHHRIRSLRQTVSLAAPATPAARATEKTAGWSLLARFVPGAFVVSAWFALVSAAR